jgi:hypothetical protein
MPNPATFLLHYAHVLWKKTLPLDQGFDSNCSQACAPDFINFIPETLPVDAFQLSRSGRFDLFCVLPPAYLHP